MDVVQNVLYVLFQVLETSGFLPEDNLIEIMNPMEEGLYAWFTVNFLLGKFDKIEQVRYYLCPYRNYIIFGDVQFHMIELMQILFDVAA